MKPLPPRVLFLALILFRFGAVLHAQEEPEVLPLVKPDLTKMKGPIRTKLESLQSELEALIAREDLPVETLADAYGAMGEYYQAHSLLDAAETAIRNAAILAPDEPKWHYYLGVLYEDRNRYDEAADRFRAFLKLRPEDHYAMGRLGNLLLRQNKPEQARAILEEALDIAPLSAFLLQVLGMAAAAQNEPRAAVEYFERALERQPQASSLNYPLGLAYRKLGDMEKATYYIQKRGEGKVDFNDPHLTKLGDIVTVSTLDVALAMAEDATVSPRDLMGYILTNLGGRPGLIEYLSAALDHKKEEQPDADPLGLARIHYAIGNLLAQEGSDEDAMLEYASAMKLAPAFWEPYLEKGFLLRKSGELEEALTLYRQVLAAKPDHDEALLGRAQTLVAMDRNQDAIDDLRKVVSLNPKHGKARIELATLLAEQGETAQAKEMYQSAIREDLPDNALVETHNHLGRLFQAEGDHVGAANHFRASLRILPDQEGARLNLAASLAALGMLSEAGTEYAAILETNPENVAAWLGRIAATILDSDFSAAKTALDEALDRHPDHSRILHLSARFLAAVPVSELRDGTRAIALAEKTLAIDKSFAVGETYAMALAQAGQFEKAGEWQQALVVMAEEEGQETLAAILKANLALYQAGKPCCAKTDPVNLLP